MDQKQLKILFLVFMIPNIFVYAYHTIHEFEESFEHIPIPAMNHKGNEQFIEGVFFLAVTIGYTIATIQIMRKPKKQYCRTYKAYYWVIYGTFAIIIIYYLSKTIGVPAPDFYDWVIIDDTTNWKDAVTKVAQQIFVVILAALLYKTKYREMSSNNVKVN